MKREMVSVSVDVKGQCSREMGKGEQMEDERMNALASTQRCRHVPEK